MTDITKLQRWLDLIAFLVSRHFPVMFEELADHVPSYRRALESDVERERDSVRRMFERDKDELRALGIPLRTMRFSLDMAGEEREGYAIERRDFYLPYLKLVQQSQAGSGYAARHALARVELNHADAPLVLEALRRVADVPASPLAREARSAFRKLAFDLDPDAFAGDSPVLFVDRPGAAELVARLRTLSDALLARKRVQFRYQGIYRDETTERDVAPWGLLFQQGHWYLIGHDSLRDDVRVFRVGRMEDVRRNTRNPRKTDYDIPGDFRLDAYVGRQPWELGDPEEGAVDAQVRFRFPLSLWADRNRHGTLVREEPGGHAVRRFAVYQVSAFLRWVLGLGAEAEVLEPPELRSQYHAMARDIASLHEGGDDA
jgi:proteasome accessory factor B